MKAIVVICCAAFRLLSGSVDEAQSGPSTPYPAGIGFYPEMTFIPEVSEWPAVEQDRAAAGFKGFAAAWSAIFPWLESQVTPPVVRALSRWAIPQMAQYRAVPALSGMTFRAVAARRHEIILEGTADTLPTHSPLVQRWLKLFLVYDTDSSSILRIAVTIRGEVQE